jgi:hypothetical protein
VKPISKSGISITPGLGTIILRFVVPGTETFQCKIEPDILSQVNTNCPSGQTVITPSGDSVVDVAVID